MPSNALRVGFASALILFSVPSVSGAQERVRPVRASATPNGVDVSFSGTILLTQPREARAAFVLRTAAGKAVPVTSVRRTGKTVLHLDVARNAQDLHMLRVRPMAKAFSAGRRAILGALLQVDRTDIATQGPAPSSPTAPTVATTPQAAQTTPAGSAPVAAKTPSASTSGGSPASSGGGSGSSSGAGGGSTAGGSTGGGGTTGGGTTTPNPGAGWNVLANPIDPMQQTALNFGDRSQWLQPWRAYLDTPPVSKLLNAAGINFNVSPGDADAAAQLLAQSGIRRARVEIPWSALSFTDPTSFVNGDWAYIIRALKNNGIRPLVLLNANHGQPGPALNWQARLTQPAHAGDRQIRVDAATAAQVVPGLSGLNRTGDDPKAAAILFTAVSGTTVTLAAPLPGDLPAGSYPASTLRFAPFGAPLTAGGSPNPAFEATLAGWLSYAGIVTRGVRSILGSDDFDVEIWNEETFGADFLNAANYYDPLPAAFSGTGDIKDTILRRTVAYLRNPVNGVSGIGIGDGFANQTPWPSGATEPAGITAIDKHPYHHDAVIFPAAAGPAGQRPLDALGHYDGIVTGTDLWQDRFTPSYVSFFPEYYLNALQTEHMVRDMSPLTTYVGSTPHGRFTHPAGSAAPQEWITETNITTSDADLLNSGMTAADKRHLQAKAVLRTLTSFVNKGVDAIDFYAANGAEFGLIDPSASDGGETLTALRRLTSDMAPAGTITRPRSLTLDQIADQHNHFQWQGDGTAAHPTLFDRDVLAVLPFQAGDDRFVVPYYVMTRNMAKVEQPDAAPGNTARFDLPPAIFRLTLGGVAAGAHVSATDPMTGAAVPVTVVSSVAGQLVVDVPATDAPRLLVIDD